MTTTLGEAAANVLAKTPRPWNGEKITEPGAYLNIPLSEYHGNPDLFDGPAVSSTGLRDIFSKSPAHYWAKSLYNPAREPSEVTDAMILGSAVHWLVAGEPDFWDHFVLRPDAIEDKPWQGNRIACKDWLKNEPKGRFVVTSEMMARVGKMAGTVRQSPYCNQLGEGMPEVSLFYRDEKTGIWVKARPDNTLSDWSVGLDLKCVADVTDRAIANALDDRDYRMQASVIRSAVKHAIGADMTDFGFLFVESKDTYSDRLESIHPDDMDLADEQVRVCLDVFKRCWDRGEWPGPKNRAGDGAYFRMSETTKARKSHRIEVLQEMAA